MVLVRCIDHRNVYHLAHYSTHVDAYVHTTIDVHIHAGAPKISEHAGHMYVDTCGS